MADNTFATADTVTITTTGTSPMVTGTAPMVTEREQVKTFTQDEVNSIVADRLARQKKGMPSDDEIKEYRDWKAKQQSDAEKMAELTSSLNDTVRERDDAVKERDSAAKKRDEYKLDRDKFRTERDTASKALEEANAKLTQYERERFLLSKGVPEKDLDYYAFKIGKEVTEENTFEKAAEAFLKDYDGALVARFDTGADLSGGAGASTPNEQMNAIFRKARRN